MTIYASIHGRMGSDPVASETKAGKVMVPAVDVPRTTPTSPETLLVSLRAFGAAVEALDRASNGEIVTAQSRMNHGHYTGPNGALRESWTLLADALLTARSTRPKPTGEAGRCHCALTSPR